MKNKKRQQHLGVDIGRVIMAPVRDGQPDTSFLTGTMEQAMETPPTEGAMEQITRLVDVSDGKVWLVSKAGPSIQKKTRRWFRQWRFFEQTGIPNTNLRFCLRRDQKAEHCRQLRLTHFVDDRLDVLKYLVDFVPFLFLFGEQRASQQTPDWARAVLTWDETTEKILKTLDAH